MKIFYSPEFEGRVYLGLDEQQSHLMDTVVCDTIALVRLIEMRLGVFVEDYSTQHRVVKYFKALSEYMKQSPDNALADSFALSGLATAEQVLKWRDNLVFDGMKTNKQQQMVGSRLDVIVGTEQFFDCQGVADRVWGVLAKIETLFCDGCQSKIREQFGELFADWVIVLPCELELLHPTVQRLMCALKQCGAHIEVNENKNKFSRQNNIAKIAELLQSTENMRMSLDKDDCSFAVYRFADDKLANEYFAYNGDRMGVDLWINSSNRSMDNWLRLMGKPTLGSSMAKSLPQLLQLFVLGINTLREPLNIYSLIDWLYCPMQPFGSFFGGVLADTIIEAGGYRNDKCRQVVEDYVECRKYYYDDYTILEEERSENRILSEEERAKLLKQEKKRRKILVDTYLPQFDVPKDCRLKCVRLKTYLNSLGSWARSRAHWLGEKVDNDGWCRQLNALSDMCNTFVLLVDSVKNDEYVDEKQLESWIATLNRGEMFALYPAQRGSATLIDCSAKMISCSRHTVWMNFIGGGEVRNLDCSFLYPSEKEKLKDHITIWDELCESEFKEQMQMLPFFMTEEKLILVTSDYVMGEATQKHPLLVRLESQIENFKDFVVEPNLYDEVEGEKAVVVDNRNNAAQIEFKHADLVRWPEHFSPTAISTLVEYPFDYMMERILKIEDAGTNSVKDIKATKGVVAHAVIEELFAPREGQHCSMIDEISHRVNNEFDTVFRQKIEACGAILYLPENKLAAELLRRQLKHCIAVLLKIIKDNNLLVIGCEHQVKLNMGLIENEDGWDMIGYIDMIFEDENHRPVVFDFKWTSSKSFYRDLLVKNRSIQLELYRAMLSDEQKKSVERTAYFLMPEGHLYSKEFFVGENCTQVVAENTANIVEQLLNSFNYRKQQIDNGIVEVGDNFNYISLDYYNDTKTKDLFPLQKGEEDVKEENRFSNYGLFK